MKNIPYISWQTGGPFNFSSEDCIQKSASVQGVGLRRMVPKRTQDVDGYQLRLVVEIPLLIEFFAFQVVQDFSHQLQITREN